MKKEKASCTRTGTVYLNTKKERTDIIFQSLYWKNWLFLVWLPKQRQCSFCHLHHWTSYPFVKDQFKGNLLHKLSSIIPIWDYSFSALQQRLVYSTYVTGVTGVKNCTLLRMCLFLYVSHLLQYKFLKIRSTVLHNVVFNLINTVTALVERGKS